VRACALFIALSPLLVASVGGAASRPPAYGKDPKLDSRIVELVEASGAATGLGPQALPAGLEAVISSGQMRFDEEGRLSVFVYPSGSLEAAAAAVEAAGGRVVAASQQAGAVQATLPRDSIRATARDPAVRYVGLPRYPVLNAGSRVTEGDVILGADEVRVAYGVDGSGVKVGVISNGIYEFEKSQLSGDLPVSIDYSTCDVVPGFDPRSPLAGGEGTAMLEIVHDIAPGAELWFANFGMNSPQHGTEIDFINAVTCLAEHVDVIVDDISWFGTGPYDGTSPVSSNTSAQLADPENPVRLHTTSVGNWAQRHYGEMYSRCEGTDFQAFQETAQTVDSKGGGRRCSNPVVVWPFATTLISLVWDDPFGASCNDYDLVLMEHDSSNVLAMSRNPQSCTQDPVETITWKNPSFSVVTVDLAIENVGGQAAPRKFDLFAAGVASMGYYTPSGSVPGQGDAFGAISVGAIGAFDDPPDDIQPYSSHGPTADGRTKPDVTAIDCVNVTGNGLGAPFCGTSASAPHVAGLAALLLDCNPTLLADAGGAASQDREDLSDAILQTADDLGDPGTDNVFGAGLLNAPQAAEAVCDEATGLLGDVDCSTVVNAVDSLLILRRVAGIEPEPPCIDLGDVDCDQALDAVDALNILRYVADLPLAPPPGCRPIGS